MRDIKFRAWNKDDNRMHRNPFNGKLGGMNDIFSDTGNWIYMQFTGLLDKEGAEIYEGDILSTDFAGKQINGVMEYEISVTGAQWTKFLPLDRYEVIGNIYENPELNR